MISQIFAVSNNNVIGKNNQLPWRLPNDLKFFKQVTIGHTVIMGRKTFESLQKPLKDRTNIIITSNSQYTAEGCLVVGNFEEALAKGREIEGQEIFIIGGSSIFKESYSYIDKIYLTQVDADVDGDVIYEFDRSQWREVKREDHQKDEKHPYNYSFIELLRLG